MPNYVKNRIELIGNDAQAVIEYVKGITAFDFNKIIEMPEGTGITSGSWSFDPFADCNKAIEKCKRQFGSDSCNIGDVDTFIQGIKNYIVHGYVNWYAWSVEIWNTKWNAFDVGEWENNIINFCTAWSSVVKLIQRLSCEFPTITFKYMYADEDTGSNTGKYSILNGVCSGTHLRDQSTEAYEIAFELWPIDKKDYRKIDGYWVYKE